MAALRVLVCYASAAGSTRGIAECVADRIRDDLGGPAAAEVLCRPAGPGVELNGVDAVVLGSAVHGMAWLPAARAVLGHAAGAAAPVWVFSVGSVEPRGPLTRLLAGRERARIEQAFPAGFAPRDHRVFAGVVVMTGVPLWGRLFGRLTGAGEGDHRNWPAIERWAAGIAAELAALRPGTSPSSPRTRA